MTNAGCERKNISCEAIPMFSSTHAQNNQIRQFTILLKYRHCRRDCSLILPKKYPEGISEF